MELFIVLVFLFIIGKIIKWVINNAYIFENAIKNGLSMILPYVVSYFVLVFFHISTYPNLISKKIILQLEHEKDRRTKRRR